MLNIEEDKLNDLLNQRSHHIKTYASVIETTACLVAFIISLLLSDFFSFSTPRQVALIILIVVYLAFCICNYYGSNYSVENFYKDICSVAEKDHNFSLLIFKDTSKTFPYSHILVYEKRWRCWLFPFVRTKEQDDEKSVKEYLSEVFGLTNFKISKVTEQDVTKHSVSANASKTYHHTFYLIELDASKYLSKEVFSKNKNKYKWFTIQEMKENKAIMERNFETVGYVEKEF